MATVEGRDKRPAQRGEYLAGDIVGVIFELVDALAEYRRFVAAAQHALQGQRALRHRLGMPGEQVEKPFLLRQKSAKPTQHLIHPGLRKWPAKAACHATVIDHFPGKGRSGR